MQDIKSSQTAKFYLKTNYGTLVNGVNINRPNCVVLSVLNSSYNSEDDEYLVEVRFASNGKVGKAVLTFQSSQDASLVLTGYNFHLDSASSFKLVK